MKKLLILLIFFKMVFAFDAPPFPSYDLIIPSTTTSPNIQGNVMSLNQGWSMHGFDNGIKDLNQTFMLHNDAISLLWSYDDLTHKWFAFSPNTQMTNILINTPNVEVTNTIKSNQGFWVLATMDKNITLDPNLGIPQEIVFIGAEQTSLFEQTGGEFTIDISPLDNN